MSNAKFDAAILTKEQKQCVEFESGDLLIKGVAGSGKSYVLLRRAVNLTKKKNGEKVAVFTYANTLVKYTDELVKNAIGSDDVLISTVDSYCLKLYSSMFRRKFTFGNQEKYRSLISESLEEHKKRTGNKHRLYEVERIFFEEEFQWIREKCIKTCDDYLSMDRRGRGSHIRLNSKDRKFVWEIYELYSGKARAANYMDWP
ncbi:MAG: UvrD-helicase domain-containing protein, partial [Clostridia bacterium]|nr:UvrD-helicase domain-containing protein [Clostridia bacterium]